MSDSIDGATLLVIREMLSARVVKRGKVKVVSEDKSVKRIEKDVEVYEYTFAEIATATTKPSARVTDKDVAVICRIYGPNRSRGRRIGTKQPRDGTRYGRPAGTTTSKKRELAFALFRLGHTDAEVGRALKFSRSYAGRLRAEFKTLDEPDTK